MAKLAFEITTPEGVVYKDEIDQITIPTQQGEITVLPHHLPLVSVLVPGELKVVKDKQERFIACTRGFVEVLPNNKIVILADAADRSEDIDLTKAEEAKKRAEELLKQKSVDDVDYTALSGAIERELSKIRLARKRHTKHTPNIQ